jgi:hypothetical protein
VGPAARWDSVWYLAIAADGYAGSEARPAFFPLFPLLADLAGLPLGSALLGGLLVSAACLGGALYLLGRLTALELGPDAARHAVWLTALFPMAFFHSAVYAEGLFLLLSVGAVYAARRDLWAWAGVLGGLATATRSAGVVLLVALAALHLRAHPRPTREAAWLALVPLGLAAFCAWLWWIGLGPTASFAAQAVWLRELGAPFSALPPAVEAAWAGGRQLLSGSREELYFPGAGGDPFWVARMNLMLFAFLLLGLAALAGTLRRLPARVRASTRSPRSRCRSRRPWARSRSCRCRASWRSCSRCSCGAAGGWTAAGPRRGSRSTGLLALLALFAGIFASWRWIS